MRLKGFNEVETWEALLAPTPWILWGLIAAWIVNRCVRAYERRTDAWGDDR